MDHILVEGVNGLKVMTSNDDILLKRTSGVGQGNFEEIGQLDTDLKPRNLTWFQKADLLFVDNPVGTGYSFVENEKLLESTNEEAATDLTTLLKDLFNGNTNLQKRPLYLIGESYGGRFAVTLGLSIVDLVQNGELKIKLGGTSVPASIFSSLCV
ncbi:Serine carboxypeptidase-like 51 [Acorus calamus]|uniref:Carboxypeptidase n=1 Tax=Acorus calamus TaxID=4465 RepID=A0AAV9DBC9_ACOCL|nr:Serine carboxypeptidase-like 51 [Acorus calamus]